MIDVQMPQLGESVAEGTVTQWHVKVGEYVRREQPLLEVATDKADSEVPSPGDGVVTEILAGEGDVVATGGLLCKIDENATAASAPETSGSTEQPQARSAPAEAEGEGSRAMASPSNRKLARERGVDLSSVDGTGERGRITRDDIERAAKNTVSAQGQVPVSSSSSAGSPASAPPVPRAAGPVATSRRASPKVNSGASAEIASLMDAVPIPGVGYRSYKVPPFSPKDGDEVIPFSRRRRITADHMVYSTTVSPHVVTVAEIDIHATSELRNQHKRAFKEEGVSLTFLTFVVAATVKALREFPKLNSRVLDDAFVQFKDINVGIAVDTPSGLLVANIKQTDQLSLRGIAMQITDLATRARAGKITADDLSGTTFTVSNPGRKGNLFGGAIISQPNVAILRVGEIKKRPVVIEADGGDAIAIHPVMFSALSYDHRVVDGVEANEFLWRISDILTRAEFEV